MSEQPTRQAGCRDVIGPNLSLLFVGFNPGVASGETGYHFAGRNNRFWDLLFDVGLTPSRLAFAEDRRLLPLGYGITNIVARPTPGSGDLATAELRAGAVSLVRKLTERQPRIACYLGKGIYAALRRVPSARVAYGLQPASTVAGTLDFVAPSPSGRATIPYVTKRAVMSELATLVRANEAAAGSVAQTAFAATLLGDMGFQDGDDLLVLTDRCPEAVERPLRERAGRIGGRVRVRHPDAWVDGLAGASAVIWAPHAARAVPPVVAAHPRLACLPAIPAASLYRLYGVARAQRVSAREAILTALRGLAGPVSVTTPSGTRLDFAAAGGWAIGCPGDGLAPCSGSAGDLGQVGLAVAPGTAQGEIIADAALGVGTVMGVRRGRLAQHGQLPLTGLLIGTHPGARFSSSPTESAAVRGAGSLVLGDHDAPQAKDGGVVGVEQGQLVLIEPTIVVGGRKVVTDGRLTPSA